MGSIDGVSDFDPLSSDSMDPNDPNSILYDPSLAEKKGSVIVGPNGQVIVIPADDNNNNKDVNADAAKVAAAEKAQEAQEIKNNLSSKLRKVGKFI